MCLDMPGRVIARDGDRATVEVDGRIRLASTLLVPDVEVGDRVFVAAGTIVGRMDEQTADQIEHEIRLAREAN